LYKKVPTHKEEKKHSVKLIDKEKTIKQVALVKTPFLKVFRRCFYDISFYQSVLKNTLGQALKYCFLLILFFTFLEVLAFSAVIRIALSQFIPIANENIEKLPYENLTITEGKAQLEPNNPYLYQNENFILSIDTTKDNLDLPEKKDIALLLSSTGFRVYQNRDGIIEDRQFSFSEFKLKAPLIITKETLKNWIELARKWFFSASLLFFLLMLIFEIIKKAVLIFLVALLGYFFSKIIQLKISFQGVLSILCYLLTPYIVIQYFLSYIGMGIWLNVLLLFLMYGLVAFNLEKRSRVEIIEP